MPLINVRHEEEGLLILALYSFRDCSRLLGVCYVSSMVSFYWNPGIGTFIYEWDIFRNSIQTH